MGNGYSTGLTLSGESSGKVFGLLSFITRSLVTGTTIVVDELDQNMISNTYRANIAQIYI